MTSPDLARAESLIARIPDFPEPGILFRDISPLLADAGAMRTVIDALVAPFAGQFDVIAGVEARGFLLAGAAAVAAGVGMVPIRKAGKLPRPAAAVSYDLEYGQATIEMAADLAPGTLLAAYRGGLFPMPEGPRSVGWWCPAYRGVLELADLRVSRSLRRSLRDVEIRVDSDFAQVIARCGDPARPHGWIDGRITQAYVELHRLDMPAPNRPLIGLLEALV